MSKEKHAPKAPPAPAPPDARGPAAKPQGRPSQPDANPRLTEQNRKILGKHYANRYGKR